MKKFSLIALLGCLLTVGGVYAQWVYGQNAAASVSKSIKPQMAGVGTNSKKGTITVDTTGLKMFIDDTNGDYNPELIIEGQVTVTFTANPGADAEVVANGVKMNYSISQTADWTYDSDPSAAEAKKEIFTLVNPTDISLNEGAATNSITITAAEISNIIKLNVTDEFKLATKAQYDAFEASLNIGNFTFTVSEVA